MLTICRAMASRSFFSSNAAAPTNCTVSFPVVFGAGAPSFGNFSRAAGVSRSGGASAWPNANRTTRSAQMAARRFI